ncbi:DUF6445 family protein [Chitinimonas sp.]|uniref:DUF6445 family protein n=1 Tax=Chitinimonas sp. TaxID=1934313 RepID=UPI0035B03B40
MDRAQQLLDQGRQLASLGRAREAAALYQQALTLAPQFAPAMHQLGLALAQQGMADMGRIMLERALAIAELPGIRLDLARLYERAGRGDAALGMARQAWAGTPHDAAVGRLLARLCEQHGAVDEALQVLHALCTAEPRQASEWLALAQMAYRSDRLALAREAFEAAYALSPAILEQACIGYAEPAALGRAANTAQQSIARELQADELIDQVLHGADLQVFDDFLPDPDTMRQWAMAQTYRPAQGNYPGQQTAALRCDELMQAIADCLHRRIKWASPDNGVLRLSLADAQARTDIHVDDEQAVQTQRYAAVLYLTLPVHCQGGTSFWRHQATGWLKRPSDAQLREAGLADFRSFLRRELPIAGERAFTELTAQRQRWHKLFTVPMAYNRLVLYKGNYFHAIDSVFGSDFSDGRLTRLFTFEVV